MRGEVRTSIIVGLLWMTAAEAAATSDFSPPPECLDRTGQIDPKTGNELVFLLPPFEEGRYDSLLRRPECVEASLKMFELSRQISPNPVEPLAVAFGMNFPQWLPEALDKTLPYRIPTQVVAQLLPSVHPYMPSSDRSWSPTFDPIEVKQALINFVVPFPSRSETDGRAWLAETLALPMITADDLRGFGNRMEWIPQAIHMLAQNFEYRDRLLVRGPYLKKYLEESQVLREIYHHPFVRHLRSAQTQFESIEVRPRQNLQEAYFVASIALLAASAGAVPLAAGGAAALGVTSRAAQILIGSFVVDWALMSALTLPDFWAEWNHREASGAAIIINWQLKAVYWALPGLLVVYPLAQLRGFERALQAAAHY